MSWKFRVGKNNTYKVKLTIFKHSVFLVFFNELILFGFILACIVFKHLHKFFTNNTAAAKSLQSCPTLCDPRDSSPLGSSVPGILQARTLEWVAISFSNV